MSYFHLIVLSPDLADARHEFLMSSKMKSNVSYGGVVRGGGGGGSLVSASFHLIIV